MKTIQNLQLFPLAQHFLSELHEKHGCGWMDGGCFTFAHSIKKAFPNSCTTGGMISKDGTIEHAVIKVNNQDLYGDGEGWYTFSEMVAKLLVDEQVACESFVELDLSGYNLHHDIIEGLVSFIKNSNHVSFTLPTETYKVFTIAVHLFDCDTVKISSNHKVDCNQKHTLYIDGIKNLILAHYKAGVNVMCPKYCEGIVNSLETCTTKIEI